MIFLLNCLSAWQFNIFFSSSGTEAHREQHSQQQRQLPQQQRPFRSSQFLVGAHGPRRAPTPPPAPPASLQPPRLIQGERTWSRVPASSLQGFKASFIQTKCREEEENSAGRNPTSVCIQTQTHQTEDQKCSCKVFAWIVVVKAVEMLFKNQCLI